MKAKDDMLWAQQVSDLRADGEAGQRFLTFFTFWFDAAEKMAHDDRAAQKPIIGYVYEALDLAEQQFGYLSVDLIGQMLVVAAMHWAHGEEMKEGLTPIEQRVAEEALARKIADLQNQAKMDKNI